MGNIIIHVEKNILVVTGLCFEYKILLFLYHFKLNHIKKIKK